MIRQLTTLALLAFTAGCAHQKAEPPKPAFDSSRNPEWLAPDLYPHGAVAEKEPVVRYGRYTLVSTLPDAGQRDLMAQIIDVTIPSAMSPNVRDAMQYVVSRSGYSLCAADAGHVNILYTRPLPAAQYKLGPMTLRNTLQVLSGPAWQVKVDEVNRQVCFVLRPGYQLPPRPVPKVDSQLYAHNKAASSSSSPAVASTASQPAGVVVASVPTPAPISASTVSSTPPSSTATLIKPAAMPSSSSPEAPKASTAGVTSRSTEPAKDGRPPVTSTATAKPSQTAKPVTEVPPSVKNFSTAAPAVAASTVAVSTPSSALSRPQPQVWTADTGSTLRQSVEAWAKRAHWTLLWEADDLDYPIAAPLRFEGSFEDAIKQLFPLYDQAPRAFVVDGSPRQRLLHIAERTRK